MLQLLTVVDGIAALALIYLTVIRVDYTNGMLKSCFFLFLSVIIFQMLLMFAHNQLQVVHLKKQGVQERHDYNYALYCTLYKKNEKLRSIALLQMARQQIELQRPQMALQALEMLNRDKLNVAQLRSFYFYQAAASYLDGQEGWQEALASCYTIPQKPGQLSKDEIESLFLPENGPARLIPAVREWEKTKTSRPVIMILAAVLILYTGVYYGIDGLLSWSYHYREWVVTASGLIIFFGWTVLTLYWMVKLMKLIGKHSEKGAAAKTLQKILLVIFWVCFFLWNGLVQGLQWLGNDAEVEAQPEGLILMKHENWLDPADYYYNKAAGWFFRRTLTTEESVQYGIAPETQEDEQEEQSSADGETQDDSNTESNPADPDGTTDSEAGHNDASTTPEEIENSDSEGEDVEDPLYPMAQAVYTYMKEHGEISAAEDASQVAYSYNAKGNFYAVFENGEEDGNSWSNLLVYDRTSKNGKCELFVYEREEEGKDTQLLGFYAVEKETGEVISGEKTSWSEVGSEAYQEATGE